jgi:hypothetical protein
LSSAIASIFASTRIRSCEITVKMRVLRSACQKVPLSMMARKLARPTKAVVRLPTVTSLTL